MKNLTLIMLIAVFIAVTNGCGGCKKIKQIEKKEKVTWCNFMITGPNPNIGSICIVCPEGMTDCDPELDVVATMADGTTSNLHLKATAPQCQDCNEVINPPFKGYFEFEK